MTYAKGYLLDRYDGRDHDELTVADKLPPIKDLSDLPRRVDLRESGFMPDVWNQGDLGSCTAHGTLGNYHFWAAKEGLTVPMRSRLALYYQSRAIEGHTSEDAGAQVRDAFKALAEGVEPESEWPYDVAKFADAPPADNESEQHAALVFFRVLPSLTRICNRLAQGFPITDGMPVYESMETPQVAESGQVPMPQPGEQLMGGHCTLTVGYDLDAGTLLKRNSWGTDWGQAGYFTVPTAYTNLLMDRWAIVKVD